MARLRAEQQALNSGKWEEIRRIELANKLRKEEIDQRLKQELGFKKNNKSLGSYISKLISAVYLARRFAHFITSAINESAKYIENLNLFAVAFGDTYRESLKWALDMADAYGLASNEVLKFAGTFRELSTSLGLVADTADIVTETVTKLGYDLAALYNTTVEQAMEKLQSGIFSGNVRPLRSFGIDISQNQIDALFETNKQLAQLGVNARNLSQSDKVIARLIITLQSGKDSFGTMAREINNLQSQFRIFQGSLANFKLALGDLLEKPLSRIMVLANAFVIAMTNVIRSIVPLTKEDATPKAIINTAMGAEEASEALDTLNGKLAKFDKFNVLQDNNGSSSTLAVTEALNQLLLEQANLYDNELSAAMEKMKNEAVELAEKLEELVIYGAAFIATFSAVSILQIVGSLKNLAKSLEQMGISLFGATTQANALSAAFLALGAALVVINLKKLWSSNAEIGVKIVHTFIGIAAAISAAAVALKIFQGNWVKALTVGATVAGGYFTVINSIGGFAEGGYTNANLIMTHENGKREWVGKAAGSSAIVNDTQMSDIMEVAVAKGVYQALSARSAMSGNVPTNETIVVKIGEEAVFNAVRKTARRQGRDFANV